MVEIYSQSPLSEIIFKMSFENIPNINVKINEFHEKIKENYQFKTVETEPKISINISNEHGKIETTQEPKYWCFHNNEELINSPFIIEVAKDNCVLDFKSNFEEYKGFEDLKHHIKLLIDAAQVFNIKHIDSIGLRYINKIKCNKGNPKQWKGIISDRILFDDLLDFYNSPSRVFTEFTFKKNDFFIKFNFGIFNTEFPNAIARKEFILDFDCIYNDEINIINIFDIINEMHETISELFKENTSDSYRNHIK